MDWMSAGMGELLSGHASGAWLAEAAAILTVRSGSSAVAKNVLLRVHRPKRRADAELEAEYAGETDGRSLDASIASKGAHACQAFHVIELTLGVNPLSRPVRACCLAYVACLSFIYSPDI